MVTTNNKRPGLRNFLTAAVVGAALVGGTSGLALAAEGHGGGGFHGGGAMAGGGFHGGGVAHAGGFHGGYPGGDGHWAGGRWYGGWGGWGGWYGPGIVVGVGGYCNPYAYPYAPPAYYGYPGYCAAW